MNCLQAEKCQTLNSPILRYSKEERSPNSDGTTPDNMSSSFETYEEKEKLKQSMSP